ncbi:centrosomal protein of 104 kDa-like [Diadema setosum]|uniref:centrosomal protein of 104 kDa-like n=1 Tax=Diadema setosum TaxID=31175 RepID=UPI003B3A94B5
MPRKIPFSVVYSSSTDDGYNSKELEIHNPLVKGWVGGRFCLFPQEIVLRMQEKTRIRKLQLLAHQFLIPTKIEFFIGSLPPDHVSTLSGQRYKRLGFVTLSDNAKTGFKARELKSVHVDAIGKYLRLVIYKNHVNKYNMYNQVGLVAVNIIGDEVDSENNVKKGPNSRVNNVINQNMPPGTEFKDEVEDGSKWEVAPAVLGAVNKPDFISPMDDLAFDMYQDPEVANIIRKLDTRKNEAVIKEQFDLAKRVKYAINDLQKVGERLGRYEVEKRRAIETEDYDLAKVKKIQMDEYRLQIYKQLELYDLLEMTKSLVWPPKITTPEVTPIVAPKHLSPRQEEIDAVGKPLTPKPGQPKQSPRDSSPPVAPKVSFMYNADDRPLPTLKNSPRVEPEPQLPPVEEPEVDHTADEETGGGGTLGQSNTQANMKNVRELDTSSEVFGRDKVLKAYSKSWALREEGFNEVRNLMETDDEGKEREDLRTMLRSAIFLASKGLKDKVFSVFNSAVDLTRYTFMEFIPKHKLGKNETSQAVDKILPELMSRIGDTNGKLIATDIDFIIEMATFSDVRPLHSIPNQCQTPFKTNSQAKIAVTRVEIVERLMRELGLDRHSGMTTVSVMKFANHALEHTSGAVREAAINLIFELYKVKGSEVKDHLPPEDRPATYKNPLYARIFDGLNKIDGKPTRAELKAQAKAAKENNKKAKQAEIDELQSQLAELRAAAQAAGKLPPEAEEEKPKGKEKGKERGKEKGDRKDKGKDKDKRKGKEKDKEEEKDEGKEAEKDNGGLKAPTNKKIPPRAPSIADQSEFGEDMDQQCIFCLEKDPKFKEEGLDMHYWRYCPMLTKCQSCKQVVEVSGLTDHLLSECEQRMEFAKCPRCSETHSKAEIDKYVSEKLCQPAKAGSARCPLCHSNIPQGEESWKKHLMGKDGCKASKRREQSLKRAKAAKSDAAGRSSKAKSEASSKDKSQPRSKDRSRAHSKDRSEVSSKDKGSEVSGKDRSRAHSKDRSEVSSQDKGSEVSGKDKSRAHSKDRSEVSSKDKGSEVSSKDKSEAAAKPRQREKRDKPKGGGKTSRAK